MAKVLGILNIILRVLAVIIFLATAVLSISMAYIMYAPDEFPKPFKLVYQYPEEPPKYLPPGVLPPLAEAEAEATEEPVDVVEPGEGMMVNMSTKIINLSDPSGRKYIRTTVVLEFEPPHVDPEAEETKEAGGHGGGEETVDPNTEFLALINARMPLMDDLVITLLSTKSYDELYTAEGKEQLRLEIQDAINSRLPEFRVLSVYFTEFVVQ
jgi:flagellar FliL protein